MAGLFDALYGEATKAVAPTAPAQAGALPTSLQDLVRLPEWVQGSIDARKALYRRWTTEVADPALKAQAALDKKAKTDLTSQARASLREFQAREFRPVEGGVLNNDLLDLAAQGLAGAVGATAQALGTATGSKGLFDFGKSAQADARDIDKLLSDRTIENRTVAQERTVASRRDQLLADTRSPLNARLLALGQRWGGVDKIPSSSPELRALTDEYDRTGGTSLLPELGTAARNFAAEPLNRTAQAVGNSAPAIVAGAVGGLPGAAVAGGLLGAGQGADAFDRVMALDDAAIMANPELATRVRALGGTPQAIAAVRQQAAERASNIAAGINAPIGAAGALLGARFGAESAVTRGAAAQPFLRSAGVESGQEGVEGALNQATTNYAVQTADPTQALSAGVAPAAVEEALAGMGMTAGLRPFMRPAPEPVPPAPGQPTTSLTQEQLAAAAAAVAEREQRATEVATAAGQPSADGAVDNALRVPLPEAAQVPLLPAPTPVPPPPLVVDAQGRVFMTPAQQAAIEAQDFARRYAPQPGTPAPVPLLPAPTPTPLVVDSQGRVFTDPAQQPVVEAQDFARRYAPQPADAPSPAPVPPPPPAPIRFSSDPDLGAVAELMQAVGLPDVERADTRALELIQGLRSQLAAQDTQARISETLGRLPPRAAERFGGTVEPAWTPEQSAQFRAQFDPANLTAGARVQATEAATRIITNADAHPEFRALLEPIILPVVPSQPRPTGASAGAAPIPVGGGQPAADTAQPGGGGAGAVPAVPGTAGGQDGGTGASGPGGGQAAPAGAGRPAESPVSAPDQRQPAGGAAEGGVGAAAPGAVPQGAGSGAAAPAATQRAGGGQTAAGRRAARAGDQPQADQGQQRGPANGGPQASAGGDGPGVAQQGTLFQATVEDGAPISEAAARALEANDIGAALRDLSRTAETPVLRRIAERLAPILDGATEVRVESGLVTNTGEFAYGAASPDGTVIVLNPDRGVAQETLLHESVHAATERMLRAPASELTQEQQDARGAIAKLWRDMQTKPRVAEAMSAPAKESLSEFIAEAMTNTQLQQRLEQQPYNLGRAFARLKRFILDLLGMTERDNALAAALTAIDTLLTRPAAIYRGEPNAPDQVPEQGGVQQERQPRGQSRQAAEAGRGNRLQRAGARPQGAAQGQEVGQAPLYATSIGARATAALKSTLGSADRVRSEQDFLGTGQPGAAPVRETNLMAFADGITRTLIDHSVEATNLIDAEARAVPKLAAMWDRVKDAMLTWRNRSDAFFEEHKAKLVDPYYARLAALTKQSGRTAEDLHREAGAVAQARHALDRTRQMEADLNDTLDRATERVTQFDAMEAALRGSRDRVQALVGRVGTAVDRGIDGAQGGRLVAEALQTMSDMALSLERAGVAVPKVAQLLRSLNAAALNEASGRNVVDALQTVLTTLGKVEALVGDRNAADVALQRAQAAIADYNAAQNNAPLLERGPTGVMLEKLAAPLPGGIRKKVAQQKLAQASPEALELATLTRDLFTQLSDLAVANGVADPTKVANYRRLFPNYVSFMGDSTREKEDLAGVSPNRAFFEDADGAQTVGQPLPPIVNLVAKLHQLSNVVGSTELRQNLLDIAVTGDSALVKMAEGQGEKGAARLTVYGQVGRDQVVAKIALMDTRLSEGMLQTQVLTSNIGQQISRATGFYGRLVTQFVPAFAPINFMRDAMTRTFNFVGRQELTPGEVNKVRANFVQQLAAPGNWAQVWQFIRTGTPTGDMAVLRDAGALLLFTDTQVSEATVEAEVKRLNPTLAGALRKGGAAGLTLFEKYNRFFEAAIPLATFKALRSTGMTEAKAAAVTVDMMNFRARGTLTPWLNAAFPFFAATAQDARQTVRTLMPNGKPNPRAWAELVALAGAAATLFAMARDSDDDDEFGGKAMDALTTDHERNLVIPAGDGSYIKVPIGFGLVQLAWNFGVNAVRYQTGVMSAEGAVLNMGKAFFKTLTPTGVSDIDFSKDPAAAAVMTLMPGLAKPVAQAAMNKNFAGGKITYADSSGDEFLSEQGRAATPEVYKAIAQAMRENTGADMAPEIVQAILQGYLIGPLAVLPTLADDRVEKGLAPRNFGSPEANAAAAALGANRLVRPLPANQELSNKAYARMEQALGVLRRTNVAEPKADDIGNETIDDKLTRAAAAGATDDELQLLQGYLEYRQVDNALRREQGKLRSEADLGEFEQRRLEAMREFLAKVGSH